MIIVVMGVSGCGKTTVGRAIANKFCWQYVEGDDHHSQSNKAKMSQGIPLTDQDRYPWLQSLHQIIKRWSDEGTNGIVTCSSLKRSYRDILRFGAPPSEERQKSDDSAHAIAPPSDIDHTDSNYSTQNIDKASEVLFIFLKGSREVLGARMGARKGHFMPAHLLESQLATLEEPDQEETHVTVNVAIPIDEIVGQVQDMITRLQAEGK